VQQKLCRASVNTIFFHAYKAQNKAENHGFGVYQQFQEYYARKAGPRNRYILHSSIGELWIVTVRFLILFSLSPLQLFFGLFLALKLFLKLNEAMFIALCHISPLFKLCAR